AKPMLEIKFVSTTCDGVSNTLNLMHNLSGDNKPEVVLRGENGYYNVAKVDPQKTYLVIDNGNNLETIWETVISPFGESQQPAGQRTVPGIKLADLHETAELINESDFLAFTDGLDNDELLMTLSGKKIAVVRDVESFINPREQKIKHREKTFYHAGVITDDHVRHPTFLKDGHTARTLAENGYSYDEEGRTTRQGKLHQDVARSDFVQTLSIFGWDDDDDYHQEFEKNYLHSQTPSQKEKGLEHKEMLSQERQQGTQGAGFTDDNHKVTFAKVVTLSRDSELQLLTVSGTTDCVKPDKAREYLYKADKERVMQAAHNAGNEKDAGTIIRQATEKHPFVTSFNDYVKQLEAVIHDITESQDERRIAHWRD
ncbi:hypothetical protein CAPTEDRAFT_188486, partial [Capitella teleta]